MLTKTNKIITIKEVMKELDISSKQTIYNYISEGKLTPTNKDDWHIERRYEFNMEDVERLKKELKAPGLKTSEVAARLEVSQTTVNKLIRTGQLEAFQQEYKGKVYNFITEDALAEFQQQHEIGIRPSKKHFYDKEKNIALFQPFIKEENGIKVFARVTSVDEQIFVQTEHGEILPLEEIVKQGFSLVYQISEQKQNTKDGYATFRFKVPNFIKSNHFHLIDSFYNEIGPANMRVEKSENEDDIFLIQVKPTLINEPYSEQIELFQSALVSGFIKKRTRGIYIDSDVETVRFRVSSKKKKELEQKAKDMDMTVEEFVIYAIENINIESNPEER